jgi:hypothetical protein
MKNMYIVLARHRDAENEDAYYPVEVYEDEDLAKEHVRRAQEIADERHKRLQELWNTSQRAANFRILCMQTAGPHEYDECYKDSYVRTKYSYITKTVKA